MSLAAFNDGLWHNQPYFISHNLPGSFTDTELDIKMLDVKTCLRVVFTEHIQNLFR